MPSKPSLLEGMREGDLADLVLPLISCDEYVSKVDPEECLVFGFYVHDQDAADDLNRFLQKSATPILDTEISPAPDQHGYYMVFVELMKNDRLAENLTAILAEIRGLVGIDEWQMRVRTMSHLLPFSEDNLTNALDKLDTREKHENVLEFLRPSALSNVEFDGEMLILEGARDRHALHLIKLDRISSLLNDVTLAESPIGFGMRQIAQMNRIRLSLGENWDVLPLGKFVLLQNLRDCRGLLTYI